MIDIHNLQPVHEFLVFTLMCHLSNLAEHKRVHDQQSDMKYWNVEENKENQQSFTAKVAWDKVYNNISLVGISHAKLFLGLDNLFEKQVQKLIVQ